MASSTALVRKVILLRMIDLAKTQERTLDLYSGDIVVIDQAMRLTVGDLFTTVGIVTSALAQIISVSK